jgi:hypothetical protein
MPSLPGDPDGSRLEAQNSGRPGLLSLMEGAYRDLNNLLLWAHFSRLRSTGLSAP